ncbi:hypothetical protein MC885_016353 [Smutsia gigantea]|nr:hypothetical protein MC885_016353 [Smutsia gigantea]
MATRSHAFRYLETIILSHVRTPVSRRGRSPRPQNTPRCWVKERPRKPWPRPSKRDAPSVQLPLPPPPHNAPRCLSAPEERTKLPRCLQGRPCLKAGGTDAARTILTEGNLQLFPFLPLEEQPYSVRRRTGA